MLQQFYLRLKLLVDWDLIGLHVPLSRVAGMVLFQQKVPINHKSVHCTNNNVVTVYQVNPAAIVDIKFVKPNHKRNLSPNGNKAT